MFSNKESPTGNKSQIKLIWKYRHGTLSKNISVFIVRALFKVAFDRRRAPDSQLQHTPQPGGILRKIHLPSQGGHSPTHRGRNSDPASKLIKKKITCHYPKIFTITNLYHHNKSQFVPIYNVTKNISHNKGNTNVTTRPKGNSPRLYRQNYSKNPRAPCK